MATTARSVLDSDDAPPPPLGADPPADDRAATFRLPATAAATLPAKLQWSLVGWYRATGAFAEAEALLREIEARGGETGRFLEERARFALAMGQTDEALALFEERARRGQAATAWVALARAHLEAGDTAAAQAISVELCQSHPDLATVAALAADVARATGDLDAARAYHEGALEERADNAGALLALARVALVGGEAREAIALVDRALATAGESATAGQLWTAAAIAELADQPVRAAVLRSHAAQAESLRAAVLLDQIAAELGPGSVPLRAQRPTSIGVAAPPAGDGLSTADAPRAAAIETPSAPRSVVPLSSRPEPGLDAEPNPTPVPATPDPEPAPETVAALERYFGHPALRPGQAAVIANVLARRDTLATMPTGAGKSLTFQLPAMLLEGTTLVVSPLIALMKDQVESLPAAVRERTTLLNSTLSPDEQRRRLDEVADGAYKLVYAAPERLRHHTFLKAMRAAGTSLVVIDEAHCISLWGHDFRPDYLAIPSSLPELGDPPVLAITATATPAMAKAIATGLGRDLDRVRLSLFRPNLFYEVYRLANREEKVAKIVEICRQERGSGIVYVSSRKDAEQLAGVLRDRGVGAIPYHAGLDPDTRATNQERFMRGQPRVVVATVAFGMGVDKADVRFIVHLNPPRSLEAYAQESGRAGRDGHPARCVLLFAPSDQASLNRLARRDELDLDTIRRVYANVQRQAVDGWANVDPTYLLPPVGPDEPDDDSDPRVALGLLEQAGLLRRHPDAPSARLVRLELLPVPADATGRLTGILERARLGARERIAQVVRYAGGARCRHAALAAHLGEAMAPCGDACDVCTGAAQTGATRQGRTAAPPVAARDGAADAMAILDAVRTLPFQMGKMGLGKLLVGSVESRVRADRSPAFGALTGLTRGKVEGLIDRLVADGFLFRDVDHEYKVITLTERGAAATLDDLAAYRSPARSTLAPSVSGDDVDLDADGLATLERLHAWRRDRASRDAMPPYVVAHNSALEAVALARPATLEELGQVKGFGPARVEKYG